MELTEKDATVEHTTVIQPKSGWEVINLKEIYEYRDLFSQLVLRDVTVQYKQSVLGFGWAIINPLMTMLIFNFVFHRLGGIKGDGTAYPVWSFAGLVPWTYFSAALTTSTQSLITQAGLFTKVYFPRLIIPLTPVLAKLVDFSIAFVVLIILMLSYGYYPIWSWCYLPMLLILMMMTAAGIGMWLSALAIKYRDVKFAITFVVQLLQYAAPVVWTITRFDETVVAKYGIWTKYLYGLYPMAGVIEGFRSCLIGKLAMPWDLITVGFISATIMFVSGAFYFRKMERIFADVA